ncbi:MAG TPA: DUF5663 domain-containing protein [Candidatus Saccharimonadales bacterium]|jgi:hypothetical protein|nr:DUF5663 domain-containing protein [Candidatus Saccharimonadales bacterium]
MQEFITKESLLNLGINLDGQDVDSLLDHLNDTLQERVGTELTESLNDEQLKTLVELQDKATDEEVGNWLEANVPEFEQIVKDEIDILLGELAENTDGINKVA